MTLLKPVCAALFCVAAVFAGAGQTFAQQAEKPEFAPYYPDDPPVNVCARDIVGYRLLRSFDLTKSEIKPGQWESRGTGKLSVSENGILAEFSDDDPYYYSPMLADFPEPVVEGRPYGKRTLIVKIRVRRENTGDGQIFYALKNAPGYAETRSARFIIAKDQEVHEYAVPIEIDSPLLRLRFDIGGSAGISELQSLEIWQAIYPPVSFGLFSLDKGTLHFNLESASGNEEIVDLRYFGFDARKTSPTSVPSVSSPAQIDRHYPQKRPFEEMEVAGVVRSTKEKISRRFFAFNEEAANRALKEDKDAPTLKGNHVDVRFAKDGSGAELFRDGVRVAVIAPLLYEETDGGRILTKEIDYVADIAEKTEEQNASAEKSAVPERRLVPVFRSLSDDAREIEFAICAVPVEEARKALSARADKSVDYNPLGLPENAADNGVDKALPPGSIVGSLRFRLDGDLLAFDYDSPAPVFAPVLRAVGTMKQAVFPGVEYLEEGERSSSTADIDTDETIRFAPSIYWITQPFAAVVTDRGSATMLWDQPKTQPAFAVPDFIDGDAATSRISVISKSASGKIRIAPKEPLEDAIYWAVKTRGLPDLPKPPADPKEIERRILYGLEESALKTPDGWVHALASPKPPYNFKPSYGSDFISAIWEITGKLPETPRVDWGGGHIANYNAFLLTGKGKTVADTLANRTRGLIAQQRPDGSFRYYGKFLRGSRVDYASGDCANKLFALMEDWRLTKRPEALAAVEKGLAFVNNLPTPAGAQVWELSLHTPDIMGSSRCVLANVLAYEATGKNEYLAAARRWAITGLPFVYMWEDPELTDDGSQPMMNYATIAVFGATGWVAPNWMGRPVQWCGLDYAHALLRLAKHDSALDWKKIADGIVTSAECQLYVDEPEYLGLLPDSVQTKTQVRCAYNINPTVVHMLRYIIDGKHTNVSIADVDGHRIVAPYPVRVENGKAVVSAVKGTRYDVIIDGAQIRSILSEGEDVIDLAP